MGNAITKQSLACEAIKLREVRANFAARIERSIGGTERIMQMFDWAVDEVRDDARRHRDALHAALAEALPDVHKPDWHPGMLWTDVYEQWAGRILAHPAVLAALDRSDPACWCDVPGDTGQPCPRHFPERPL